MARPLSFLEKAPDAILRDIIGHWQGNTGRVLYPSQIENLEMHTLAYREALLRGEIQWSAEQNLVEYAVGPHMDALGAMLGCARLEPSKAECRVRFLVSESSQASQQGRVFAAGTIVSTEDGKVSFETLAPAFILAGGTESAEVTARCTAAGPIGNGLEPGVVCSLDPGVDGITAANTTASAGGAELEGDSAYRTRLLLAPGRFGCGGTRNAYRAWALEASALVADAYAVRALDDARQADPEPGDINIYILSSEEPPDDPTEGYFKGKPSAGLMDMLCSVFRRDDVRLVNDRVFVWPCEAVEYSIRAEITVFSGYDPQAAREQANAAAHEYAARQSKRLGLDITPTQILMAMSPIGERLYEVNLIEPERKLEVHEWQCACATEIDVQLAFPETVDG